MGPIVYDVAHVSAVAEAVSGLGQRMVQVAAGAGLASAAAAVPGGAIASVAAAEAREWDAEVTGLAESLTHYADVLQRTALEYARTDREGRDVVSAAPAGPR